MPSCISHAFVGACAGVAVSHDTPPRRLVLFSILAATLPDADVLAFAFRIPYDHLFGHRGILHSLSFAVLAGILIAWIFLRRRSTPWSAWPSSRNFPFLAMYFFLLIATHGVLDAFTNGGEGVAFFAPFTNERFFFDFTPIEVSPINLALFFGGRGEAILANELVWVWMPALGASVLVRILLIANRKRLHPRQVLYREPRPDPGSRMPSPQALMISQKTPNPGGRE
ncbi:MAG: metal-dependent hydrolase [Desulfobacteraceae bacterium]|nr:metal-dependent hydrolase [Desulfobacteraceae bacterium]